MHRPKRCLARVVTEDLSTEEIKQDKLINYNNSDKRMWLKNHLLWALTHNHSVTIVPEKE